MVHDKQEILHVERWFYIYYYPIASKKKCSIRVYQIILILRNADGVDTFCTIAIYIYIYIYYDDNLRSISHILNQGSQDRYYIQKLMTLKILQFIEWFQILPHSSSLR